jgi:phosphate:Na+ symporter
MKSGFKPIRHLPEFAQWFHAFSADTYFGIVKCVATGCILTLIVQSSSATLGITIGLASTGVIPFETAAALVLGENIGTTITALLASLGTTTNAKRAAYAHVVFNLIGVTWITILFPFYIVFIKKFMGHNPNMMVLKEGVETYPYITAGIATVHSVFNVANTLLFLPFTSKLAALLERLVPEKAHKEEPRLTSLDVRMLESPAIGIEQSRVEVLRMGEMDCEMMADLRVAMTSVEPDDKLVKKIFEGEETLDIMQKEVVIFLTDLLSGNVSHDVTGEGRRQLRIADEYESVSDYLVKLLKFNLKMRNAGLTFSEEGMNELLELHDMTMEYIQQIKKSFYQRHPEAISKTQVQGDAVTQKFRKARENHLKRVSESRVDPLSSVLFTDSLNAYRRVKDHMTNISEAIVGVK